MKRSFFLTLWLSVLILTSAAAEERISERTYRQLARVHELMEQERYAQAEQRLASVKPLKKHPYERALVLQTSGYLYAAQERYAEAVTALQKSLALEALPESASQATRYTLAQLQQLTGDAAGAVATLERWFRQERKPSAQAYAFAGAVYVQSGRYDLAAKHLRKAILLANDVNETWYRQLLGVYYAAEDHRAAIHLLQEMILHFPQEKSYWLRLSNLYQRLQEPVRSLAVLELAWRQGLLHEQQELLSLASAYLNAGTPHKAAKLLQASLRDGVLETKTEHWRLLGEAWFQAREMKQASAAIRRAAEMSGQPDDFLNLAELAVQLQDWPEALRASVQARRSGSPARQGRARLLEAIARYHSNELDAAEAAFTEAAKYGAVEEEARHWLDYLASGSLTEQGSGG